MKITRAEIMKLARQAGMDFDGDVVFSRVDADEELLMGDLMLFASLVARTEREACAQICDERERTNVYGVKECASAIRARF